MKWQLARDALTVIATVVSILALIRTYVLSHGKLVLMRQARWGRNYLGYVNSQARIGISVLVANPRPQPNAIVGWTAQVQSHGRYVDVPVPSGELQFSDRTTLYGVIPLALAPFSAVEAHVCLFDLPQDLTVPVKLKLIATDVSQKKHRLQCVIDKKE